MTRTTVLLEVLGKLSINKCPVRKSSPQIRFIRNKKSQTNFVTIKKQFSKCLLIRRMYVVALFKGKRKDEFKKTSVTTNTLYYLSEPISDPDTHGPFLNFSLRSGLARNTDPDPAIKKKTVPKAEI